MTTSPRCSRRSRQAVEPGTVMTVRAIRPPRRRLARSSQAEDDVASGTGPETRRAVPPRDTGCAGHARKRDHAGRPARAGAAARAQSLAGRSRASAPAFRSARSARSSAGMSSLRVECIWPLAAALDIEPSALIADGNDAVNDLYCVRAGSRRACRSVRRHRQGRCCRRPAPR